MMGEKKVHEFEVEELREIVKKKTLANAELREKLYDAEATIALLREKSDNASSRLEPLQVKLKQAEKELNEFKDRNDNQKGLIKSLEDKIGSAVEEKNKYLACWKEAEGSLTEIMESLEQFNNLYKVARKIIRQEKLLSKSKLRTVSGNEG